MDTGKRHENLKISKLYISGYKFTTNRSVTFSKKTVITGPGFLCFFLVIF